MGNWLRIACFLTSVFLIINVFPHFSRKKNRATSPPESRTYPFSIAELKEEVQEANEKALEIEKMYMVVAFADEADEAEEDKKGEDKEEEEKEEEDKKGEDKEEEEKEEEEKEEEEKEEEEKEEEEKEEEEKEEEEKEEEEKEEKDKEEEGEDDDGGERPPPQWLLKQMVALSKKERSEVSATGGCV